MCHRIQNHISPLSSSLRTACARVSSGNCRYRGSMCTPPPALQRAPRSRTRTDPAGSPHPVPAPFPTHCRRPSPVPSPFPVPPARSSRPAQRPSDANMAAAQPGPAPRKVTAPRLSAGRHQRTAGGGDGRNFLLLGAGFRHGGQRESSEAASAIQVLSIRVQREERVWDVREGLREQPLLPPRSAQLVQPEVPGRVATVRAEALRGAEGNRGRGSSGTAGAHERRAGSPEEEPR